MGDGFSLSFFPVVCHPLPALFDPCYGVIWGQICRIFKSNLLPKKTDAVPLVCSDINSLQTIKGSPLVEILGGRIGCLNRDRPTPGFCVDIFFGVTDESPFHSALILPRHTNGSFACRHTDSILPAVQFPQSPQEKPGSPTDR